MLIVKPLPFLFFLPIPKTLVPATAFLNPLNPLYLIHVPLAFSLISHPYPFLNH